MKKLKIIHYLVQNLLPTPSRDVKTIISLLCVKYRLYIKLRVSSAGVWEMKGWREYFVLRERRQIVTRSDRGWQEVTGGDRKWQTVTGSGRLWQEVTEGDRKWQAVPGSDRRWQEVTDGKRKLHFKSFLTSTYQIWQKRRKWWARRAVRMDPIRGQFQGMVAKPEGNNSVENLLVVGTTALGIYKRWR